MCRYIAGQLEFGETDGRAHIQMYTAGNAGYKKTAAGWAKDLYAWLGLRDISPDLHFHCVLATENERSLEKVRIYCQKEETRAPMSEPWSYGTPPSGAAGAPKALDELRAFMATGDNLGAMITKGHVGWDLLSKHLNFLKYAEPLFAKDRDPTITPEVIELFGAPGTGKSSYWMENYPDAYVVPYGNGGGSFWVTPEIANADTLIFEEFYGQVPADLLLRIVDRYPLQLQYKGGQVKLKANRFVFTSNLNPDEWYAKMKLEHPQRWDAWRAAYKRRADEWGTQPNFQLALRTRRLEARLNAAGGAAVILDGARVPRRIVPDRVWRNADDADHPEDIVWEHDVLSDSD